MNTHIQPLSKCDASQYKIYKKSDADSLFKGKSIYIWGAGQKGRGFLLALQRNGYEVKAFLDSKESMIGKSFHQVPIIHPDTLFHDPIASENAFILTASVDSKHKDMFAICEKHQFKKGITYENIQTLSPLYPTVEITGVCNIRCPSCPRGNPDKPLTNGSYMSFDNYQKVLDKLIEEIPFLYLVDLYIWSEPILNKALPEMIRYSNSKGIACGLSTNLNNIRGLDAVIKEAPAQIRVSLSGATPETYNITHDGGKWDKVEKNLHELAHLIKKHQVDTLVEVYFHVYKHNMQDYPALKNLCAELGFNLVPSIAMLFPDYVKDYVNGVPWNDKTQKVHDLTLIDVEELLEDAKKQDDKMCLLTRVFPVVNWDTTVMPCCNYSYSNLGTSYLDTPLSQLIQKRTHSDLCQECQSHSMHRYFNPVFYTDYIKQKLAPYNT
jgi:MoaA/NifB/PqqE/SkfB family radical SAM enzyme